MYRIIEDDIKDDIDMIFVFLKFIVRNYYIVVNFFCFILIGLLGEFLKVKKNVKVVF